MSAKKIAEQALHAEADAKKQSSISALTMQIAMEAGKPPEPDQDRHTVYAFAV